MGVKKKKIVDNHVRPHTERDGCEREAGLLEERSERAALDLCSIVGFLFGRTGQEVEGDVMGGVHPDCLLYSSQPDGVQRSNLSGVSFALLSSGKELLMRWADVFKLS